MTKRWRGFKLIGSVLLGLVISLSGGKVFKAHGLWQDGPMLTQPVMAQQIASQETEDLSGQVREQARRGRQLFANGQYLAAVAQWQEIAEAYGRYRDWLGRASALSNLSLSYQQLGQWSEAQDAIAQAQTLLSHWQEGASEHQASLAARSGNLEARYGQVKAQVTMAAGSLEMALGHSEQALEYWQQAAEMYRSVGDEVGRDRALINQAQALRDRGYYRQALERLDQVTARLEGQPNSVLKATALQRLGEMYRLSGNLSKAQVTLTRSLAVGEQSHSPAILRASFLSLGHTAWAMGDRTAAEAFYRQALGTLQVAAQGARQRESANQKISGVISGVVAESTAGIGDSERGGNELRASDLEAGDLEASEPEASEWLPVELAQLALWVETGQRAAVNGLWPQIQARFEALPASRVSLYQQLNWAHSLIRFKQTLAEGANKYPVNAVGADQAPEWGVIVTQLQRAYQQAQRLTDDRAQAYLLGTLGLIYEQNQQWADAQALTERAITLSDHLKAPDMLYRWQGQLGRILQAQNNPQRSHHRAIEAYARAVDLLSELRGELVSESYNTQFSFQETVEPIYRQLVKLLIEKSEETPAEAAKALTQAREVIEALRLAELDNYFKEACLDFQSVDINQVDAKAAVLYPIVLEDRLTVLVSLPGQPLQHFSTPVSAREVNEMTADLRQHLVLRSRRDYFEPAQQLYQWLIGPVRPRLDAAGVETVVFVLDGTLQNVPMATLHDGSRFFVEDYNIALTPGTRLMTPQPWKAKDLSLLAGGLTESRHGLVPLPYVAIELEKIAEKISHSAVLLNQQFTEQSLPQRLKSKVYPVVHIATHAQIGSTPEETYLVVWDGKVNVREVGQMLQANIGAREAIDLLVLSACDSASGDRRAALGLTGVAIKAGARSTLGTLWAINDEATAEFVDRFYQALIQPGATRSSALRTAQLALLHNPEYAHPIYWAPYVLLGSWL